MECLTEANVAVLAFAMLAPIHCTPVYWPAKSSCSDLFSASALSFGLALTARQERRSNRRTFNTSRQDRYGGCCANLNVIDRYILTMV
jgi:hypothetical protein